VPVSEPAATANLGTPATTSLGVPGLAPPEIPANTEADVLQATRMELAQAAQDLGALLDESWRNYLALPRNALSGNGLPTIESLEQSLKRFEAVTKDNRYKVLLDRPEFQQLYGLLQTYAAQVRQATPPTSAGPSASLGPPALTR
jgi:hypothetical protein